MLTITFHNDGTGSREIGNYNVIVAVNGVPIDRARVEGHERAKDWRHLVAALVAEEKERKE